MKRLLVTTALEGSWDDTQPMLFLGEWCRLYSRRHRWSELDVEVLPYHWDNREQFIKDRRFLELLYEDLLLEVSEKLNEFHGTNHSLRYWRILVGPWLGYFTQTLFDRWSSIQDAIGAYQLSGTIVIIDLEDARVPNDMDDYLHLGNSHRWNHYLYSKILIDFTDVACVRHLSSGDEHGTRYGSSTEIAQADQAFSLKANLIAAYSSIASRFTRSTDCLIVNTCLRSLRDELALQRRLGQVPRLVTVKPPDNVPVDESFRRWELGGTVGTDFSSCLRSLIPEQIPTAYLEGYGELCDESNRRRWPREPRAIFTGGSHYYDDVFKEWCAAKTEEGAPLVIAQHGGHVGTAWSFANDHQLAIADQFLSWGWSDPDEPKVVPVGMLKAPILPVHGDSETDCALLVTGNTGLQCSTLGSYVLSSQFLDYLEDQYAFVDALAPSVRSALTVRLAGADLDWAQAERWRDRCPSVALDDGRRPILDLVVKARLYIATTNGTTFLEAFFMDVPTVLFWDTSRWDILESARPFFDELARVGVFHDSPESAAAHVSGIWPDVESWWKSDEVVGAVTRFSRMYCDRSTNVVDEIRLCLLSVVGGVWPR